MFALALLALAQSYTPEGRDLGNGWLVAKYPSGCRILKPNYSGTNSIFLVYRPDGTVMLTLPVANVVKDQKYRYALQFVEPPLGPNVLGVVDKRPRQVTPFGMMDAVGWTDADGSRPSLIFRFPDATVLDQVAKSLRLRLIGQPLQSWGYELARPVDAIAELRKCQGQR